MHCDSENILSVTTVQLRSNQENHTRKILSVSFFLWVHCTHRPSVYMGASAPTAPGKSATMFNTALLALTRAPRLRFNVPITYSLTIVQSEMADFALGTATLANSTKQRCLTSDWCLERTLVKQSYTPYLILVYLLPCYVKTRP